MNLMDFFINKAISSGYIKSRIQAGARALALSGAGYLVQHGLANQQTASVIVGAVVGIVAVYLQDLDVKVVDGKIKIALQTNPPDSTPSGSLSPASEQTETKELNLAEANKNK